MASVAPSPEVVVERSVVAGSVVEGGAGDVVVAGSLVAGPVVAGLVTGQPHVKQPPQHFCSYCGVWMSGDPESLRRHYEGARHKDRVAKKKKETHAGPSAVGIAAPVVPVGIALALVEMALVPREIA